METIPKQNQLTCSYKMLQDGFKSSKKNRRRYATFRFESHLYEFADCL